jgi:hypothetical protein
MADNKPKIDLKARLGKKTVSSPGGSIPPPMGIPKPAGIPAPPFASSPSRPAPPRIDASDPYSAIEASAAPVRTEPAAIKVEISEEVVRAQRKGKGRVIALAVITAAVGGLVGFTIGGGNERSKGTKAAIVGAQELAKEVDTANAKIEELAEVLKSAKEKLAKNQYPEEEVSKLGGINIPFEGSNLAGKGIGRFRGDLVTLLIDFAASAEKANDQKEKIQNVLSGSKKGLLEFLESQTKPQVRWSVVLTNGPSGPWAMMQAVPAPFLAKGEGNSKWPDEIKVKDGDREVAIKRYTSGNPIASDPLFMPVDPTTQGSVCPSDVLIKLRRELIDMERVLRGDQTPGDEQMGLLESGHKLAEKLKELGRTQI